MSRLGVLIGLIFGAGALAAQPAPQFVWEGQVDGTVVLHILADKVQVETKKGFPAQNERPQFFAPLPDSRQNARLEVREGRGQVRITQQPTAENDYTLDVTINDLQDGSSFYSIALFWDTNRGSYRNESSAKKRRASEKEVQNVTWTGRVDGDALIVCRGNVCQVTVSSSQPVANIRYHFTNSLPNEPVKVSLDGVQGKGQIQLLEQPAASNQFAAKVLIRNPSGGANDYSFTLSWMPPKPPKSKLGALPGAGKL